MNTEKLILGLAINTRSCIDFLKTHKDFQVSKRLHGAKKTLIRYLLANHSLVECRRVLQFNPNHRVITGHCMVKFVFDVLGHAISFHLPYVEAMESVWPNQEFNFTDKKVRLLFGTIPPTGESAYRASYLIKPVIDLLNALPNIKHPEYKHKYLAQLEEYINEDSPLKLAL